MLIIFGVKTKRAIEHYGGVARLAEVLSISRAAIYQWGDEVPEGRAFQLELLTGGALKVADDSPSQQAA